MVSVCEANSITVVDSSLIYSLCILVHGQPLLHWGRSISTATFLLAPQLDLSTEHQPSSNHDRGLCAKFQKLVSLSPSLGGILWSFLIIPCIRKQPVLFRFQLIFGDQKENVIIGKTRVYLESRDHCPEIISCTWTQLSMRLVSYNYL
jgi:hypothetical protein